ncbi:hypothetical protein BY458DRAFT_492232 [Sporodiniella umbellata]|nr:hypothetical protein BY458DRAFT_492232 [Sporodiniella umbellata]
MNEHYQLESSNMECDVEEIPKEKLKPREVYIKSNQDKEVKKHSRFLKEDTMGIIDSIHILYDSNKTDTLEQQLQNMITEKKNKSENTLDITQVYINYCDAYQTHRCDLFTVVSNSILQQQTSVVSWHDFDM